MVRIEDAVVVAAHPDDEVLWFSSLLNRCKRVVVCFGPSASSNEPWDAGRAALIDSYPLTKTTFLKLRESGAFSSGKWKKPVATQSGIKLRRSLRRYDENAVKLASILAENLDGEEIVFTHNPWGEYGNEEHVQVFRILDQLSRTQGFQLWVDSYISNRSYPLMAQSAEILSEEPICAATDLELASEMKKLYLDNDCWTWRPDYEWPRYEAFYRVERDEEGFARKIAVSASPPLNYLGANFNRNVLYRAVAAKAPAGLKAMVKRILA